ncbi:hypothetical protein [Chitinimonas koreensis]|uniref:hypothetical protein n=1 Tax=Chitinimonas koreensis TaxID=356302 RepID=UPI00048A9A29|nr:hypothetical protein [Chitinimonas koreensis]QNM94883.1 hypothetical protein H9L41_13220 [Chitinimonas koreensis]
MFRVYLRHPDQSVSDKTNTSDPAVAQAAYDALLDRAELIGSPILAVMNQDGKPVAHHRFDGKGSHGGARPGGGRPSIGDVRRNVTLPQDVEDYLRDLGDGGLSAGIIKAVRRLQSTQS